MAGRLYLICEHNEALSRPLRGQFRILKRRVAFQNNQRLLGYCTTSGLDSCSPRCNRPPRANPNPERAEVRHAEGTSALGVALYGVIDKRGQTIFVARSGREDRSRQDHCRRRVRGQPE
jgi:hypothetical protein